MKQKIFKHILFTLALSMLPMTALHAMEQQPKVANSVSLICYPAHVKLEINGMAYNRTGTGVSFLLPAGPDRSLNELIAMANSGGKPFVRFVFDVDDAIVSRLLEYMKVRPAFYATCSFGATHPLRNEGICSIPAPLSISPLITANYLAMGKKVRLDKIKKIEYYGHPSLKNDVIIMTSTFSELFFMFEFAYASGVIIPGIVSGIMAKL